MTDVRILARSTTHADARALLAEYFEELRSRLGEFDPARSVSAEPEELHPPTGAFLVLYDAGAPVACGGVKTLRPGVGEIKRMFVAPGARGRGHGRRLLAEIEEAARTLGHASVVLDTAAPLVEAARLYESAGYRAIDAYNENPYAARWYAKTL
jgi:GNAT superfamily N-acetyltransferase